MTKRVTIVFDYDILAHEGNPFKAETPFGYPVGITNGDVQESAATTQELGEALEQLVQVIDSAGLTYLADGLLDGERWFAKAMVALQNAKRALKDFAGAVE